jgi:nicotinate-nucleotide adenylyltransferase
MGLTDLALKSASERFGSIRAKLPLVGQGQRIGLLGGSFNPPHAAHRLITHTALRRLQLAAVWWVVTPGNPLKSHDELAPLAERMRLCREMTGGDPRIKITDFEADLSSAYTAATLGFLKQRFPTVRFVWLMGADNLATFHKWQEWQGIAESMPIAVVDRPQWRLKSMASHAAERFCNAYLPESAARKLPAMTAPAWTFLTGPLSDLSSTAIRAARRCNC